MNMQITNIKAGSESRLKSIADLQDQNQRLMHTGGVSQNNRGRGFRPAFQDAVTGTVYLSRFTDGREAPIHILEGLPHRLVAERNNKGCVLSLNDSIIAGFVRDGLFYTREQAAAAIN